MASAATITTQVDADIAALVGRLARERGITDAEFVAEAVRRVAESEADFSAFIHAGVEALDRGDVVGHQELMADLDRMIERQQARCHG